MSDQHHFALHLLAFVAVATVTYVLLVMLGGLTTRGATLGGVVAGATAATVVNALVHSSHD
ncbi:MAG: hypothetical protein ACTHMJ_13605 [Thermomicrobiales bacterium]